MAVASQDQNRPMDWAQATFTLDDHSPTKLSKSQLDRLDAKTVNALALRIAVGDGEQAGKAKVALLVRQWFYIYSKELAETKPDVGHGADGRYQFAESQLARFEESWDIHWPHLALWLEQHRPDVVTSLILGHSPSVGKVNLSTPDSRHRANKYKPLVAAASKSESETQPDQTRKENKEP